MAKVEEIESFVCKQRDCIYNYEGECDATMEWAELINDEIDQHQEDHPDEDELSFDEMKAELIPETPDEDNCELCDIDEEKCPHCGGDIEWVESYSMEEFWGAMVRRPEHYTKCAGCGEEF